MSDSISKTPAMTKPSKEESAQAWQDVAGAQAVPQRWPLGQRRVANKAHEFAQQAGTNSSMDPAAAAEVLAVVRKRAADWRDSTAGVLAVITAALVITDVSGSIGPLDQWLKITCAASLAGSALLGLSSLYLVIRAANGPSWLDVRITDARGRVPHLSFETQGKTIEQEVNSALVVRDLRRAGAAAYDLWWAQRTLALSSLIFILIVAATWAGSPGTS